MLVHHITEAHAKRIAYEQCGLIKEHHIFNRFRKTLLNMP